MLCSFRKLAGHGFEPIEQGFRAMQDQQWTAFLFLLWNCYLKPSTGRVWDHERSGVWWQHILVAWGDAEWRTNFQMKRTTFMELCHTLRPHLHFEFVVRAPLTLEHHVGICLWRLATNVEYRTISHLFGVGISTVCNVVMQVTKVIAQVMLQQFIRIPSEEEFKVIIQGYRDLFCHTTRCGGPPSQIPGHKCGLVR